ncbi:BspA family leucine-rich repeat surface protein [Bifidobacterium dolichotidis]|uniref:BspA family leucine-rich repeat surface protein n=1 Tax=Bifidobacterium dolichotidis TaxID=2306976 RepID=UPI0013DDEBFB|nr:BspA family leucine-rich repeat surface protein [Bifidobacterium dolichotidis]
MSESPSSEALAQEILEHEAAHKNSEANALHQDSPATALNTEELPVSGTWGECKWEITEDGELRIHPGKAADTESINTVPWAQYAHDITKITAEEDVNTSAVTHMDYLFYNCANLEAIDGLDYWDTSHVTSMRRMFSGDSVLPTIALCQLLSWDTSSVTDMTSMFSYCYKLDSLHALADWDTSQVRSMIGMFAACTGLSNTDALQDWDVSSVVTFSTMFMKSGIQHASLGSWQLTSAKDLDFMFHSCEQLQTLDVSSWDTSHVRSAIVMFSATPSLNSIRLGSHWFMSEALRRGSAAPNHDPLSIWKNEEEASQPLTWQDLGKSWETTFDAGTYTRVDTQIT